MLIPAARQAAAVQGLAVDVIAKRTKRHLDELEACHASVDNSIKLTHPSAIKLRGTLCVISGRRRRRWRGKICQGSSAPDHLGQATFKRWQQEEEIKYECPDRLTVSQELGDIDRRIGEQFT